MRRPRGPRTLLAAVDRANSVCRAVSTTAQKQITTAVDELKGLDPKGEPGGACSQAPACTSLTG